MHASLNFNSKVISCSYEKTCWDDEQDKFKFKLLSWFQHLRVDG